jgi:hypothetical protein
VTVSGGLISRFTGFRQKPECLLQSSTFSIEAPEDSKAYSCSDCASDSKYHSFPFVPAYSSQPFRTFSAMIHLTTLFIFFAGVVHSAPFPDSLAGQSPSISTNFTMPPLLTSPENTAVQTDTMPATSSGALSATNGPSSDYSSLPSVPVASPISAIAGE